LCAKQFLKIRRLNGVRDWGWTNWTSSTPARSPFGQWQASECIEWKLELAILKYKVLAAGKSQQNKEQ